MIYETSLIILGASEKETIPFFGKCYCFFFPDPINLNGVKRRLRYRLLVLPVSWNVVPNKQGRKLLSLFFEDGMGCWITRKGREWFIPYWFNWGRLGFCSLFLWIIVSFSVFMGSLTIGAHAHSKLANSKNTLCGDKTFFNFCIFVKESELLGCVFGWKL